MVMGRFSSQLRRAAMPVRHDIAPAREPGSARWAGTSRPRKIRSRSTSSPPPCSPSEVGTSTYVRVPNALITWTSISLGTSNGCLA